MPDCLLETRDLAFYTPEGLPLFRAEGFRLLAGDFLHIHGENGSGKSTAVKAFLGRYSHFTGEISRFFQPEKVAFLPQMGNTSHLLPLSLGDVVGLACDVTADSIAKVGLLKPDELRRPWNTSSGGERQKALLTQVFGSGAELIILDEPFNHLDTAARAAVTGLIAAARRAGTAIIAVSHDTPALAAKASLSLCTTDGGSISGTQRRGRKPAASRGTKTARTKATKATKTTKAKAPTRAKKATRASKDSG